LNKERRKRKDIYLGKEEIYFFRLPKKEKKTLKFMSGEKDQPPILLYLNLEKGGGELGTC